MSNSGASNQVLAHLIDFWKAENDAAADQIAILKKRIDTLQGMMMDARMEVHELRTQLEIAETENALLTSRVEDLVHDNNHLAMWLNEYLQQDTSLNTDEVLL